MKLTHAGRRAAFAGLVAGLLLSVSTQAWAADDCVSHSSVLPDQVRIGATRDSVPASALALVSDPNATTTSLGIGMNDCRRVLSQHQGAVPALMCVAHGDISLARLNVDPQGNYLEARCYLDRVNRLRGAHGDERASANALRADALVGLLGLNVGADQTAVYNSELLEMHDAAPTQVSEAVHMTVARIYVAQNTAAGAASAESEAAHLNDPRDRALTLISVAQLQRTLGQGPDIVNATLRRAHDASDSVATNSALGTAYFDMGDWNRAASYLNAAIHETPQPDEQAYLPDAYYHLSMVEAHNGNFLQALARARSAGPSNFAYQRQLCLMELKVGGAEVYSRDSGARTPHAGEEMPGYAACNLGASSPEAQLLLGMFWLRHAQFRGADLPPRLGTQAGTDWRDAVYKASQAFNNGSRLLGTSTAALDWPAQPAVQLSDMLNYGQTLAAYVGTFCAGPPTPAHGVAEGIFVNYSIVRSPGMPNRCLPP
jgi:tetratricopeptide (TPR) repeat protein